MVTLPASSHNQGGIDAVGGVQWPVIDDLRSLAVWSAVGLTVHEQFHIGEADVHGVVMPFVVAHLAIIP